MGEPSMIKRIAYSSDRGQLIPLVALALVVLMGAAALAVDVGYWRYQQRLEQSAADSGAIAGASEISYPAANDVAAAAQADATANGFTQGVANTTVVVNQPPQSGPNSANANAVEVIITRVQPTFFAGIFGHSQTVQARAVAVLSSANAGCLYVLKGNISGNLTLNGGGRGGITSSPLCGMVVNGDMTVTGQANVDMSYISYAGGAPGGGSYPHGQPVHSVAGTDPCTRLPGCAYLATLKTTNPGLFSAACMDASGLPASPLPPGHYCGGPYSTAVTLSPGLYIMDQGMFAGQTAGTGVTIYNNCTVSKTNACSTTLSGGDVNDSIVAPLTGATAGMAYYQPPTLLNAITVNGAAGTVQQMGGLYAPGADFTFNGQLPTLSLLVAGTITMNGGGINVGSAGGFPQPGNAVLAE
jgi:hypothetical protein